MGFSASLCPSLSFNLSDQCVHLICVAEEEDDDGIRHDSESSC